MMFCSGKSRGVRSIRVGPELVFPDNILELLHQLLGLQFKVHLRQHS